MVDMILDTVQGIIFNDFPKNNSNQPIVFDHPIIGWYKGDRSILSETPGIVIECQSSPPKDYAFATKLIEHSITVSCWMRSDNTTFLLEQSLEFSRLVYECILPHRRMWAMTKCPICLQWALSPQHFVLVHPDIFGRFSDYASISGSYVSQAKNNFATVWEQTHVSGTEPSLLNSGLAVNAFYLLYNDVANDNLLPVGLSGTSLTNIQSFQVNKVRPVKLLFDCVFSEVKPSITNNDQGFFRGGEFTFKAKELIKITNFGPDNNESTDSWTHTVRAMGSPVWTS